MQQRTSFHAVSINDITIVMYSIYSYLFQQLVCPCVSIFKTSETNDEYEPLNENGM